MKLHAQLRAALRDRITVDTEPTFVDDGYRPHVTDKPHRQFKPSEQHTVQRIYLVELLHHMRTQTKRVRSLYDLKDS